MWGSTGLGINSKKYHFFTASQTALMEYPPLIKLLLLSTKQIKVIPFEIYLRETPKTWVSTQHGNVSFAQPMVFKMGMKAKSLIYYFSLLSSSQAGEIDGRIHLSITTRVAEVVRRYEGPLSKSLVSEESLSPNIRYFVAILKFVVIYALF